MFERYPTTLGFLSLGLLVGGGWYLSHTAESDRLNTLRFSTTASWDSEFEASAKEPFQYPDFSSRIQLPHPPANTSRETKAELAYLKGLERARTSADIRDIYSEMNLTSIYFSGRTISEYMDPALFPDTARLLKASFHDLTVLMLQKKAEYDRVRPSVLDPSLSPAMSIPGHPAYPSGHSAQTHFLALVFSELDPSHGEYYAARAAQIAHNREIAGVHYPSDTAAGKLLAEHFFDALRKNEKFAALLEAAKQEWATHPDLVRAQASR